MTYLSIIFIVVFSSFSTVIDKAQADNSQTLELAVDEMTGTLNEEIDIRLTDTTKREEAVKIMLPVGVDYVKCDVKDSRFDKNKRELTLNSRNEKTIVTIKPTAVGQVKLVAKTKTEQQDLLSNELAISVSESQPSALETSISAAETVTQPEYSQSILDTSEKAEKESASSPATNVAATDSAQSEANKAIEKNTTITTEQLETAAKVRETTETTSEKAMKRMARAGTEVNVTTWAEFQVAWKDATVSKINLMNDLKATGSISFTARSLELNGNGHKLELTAYAPTLNIVQSKAIYDFHMHDLIASCTVAADMGYLDAGIAVSNGGKWRMRLGNIKTEGSKVQRIVVATGGEMTWYGVNDISTCAENVYTGSTVFEPGTQYTGNVSVYNYSVFYYNLPAVAGNTGESKEFTVGENSIIQIGQTQNGTTYPAVYMNYAAMTIGENAIFNVIMPGNAVRMQNTNSSFTAKKGAIVNLTSRANAESVYATVSGPTFTAEAGSYLYIIGVRPGQPLVKMYSTTTMTIDNPAGYDIRNYDKGANSRAIELSTTGTFNLTNTDIDLWKTTSDPLGPSDLTSAKVANFKVYSTNGAATSSEASLVGVKLPDYRRIAGMNQIPTVEWPEKIADQRVNTDADKTITARVKIGEVPNNDGPTAEGKVTYIPVYASEGQASVTFIDEAGQTYTGITDKDGYARYTVDSFYKAGTTISGVATRGPYTGESASTTISDITPPPPAKIDQPIKVVDRSISGSEAEAGATIRITINGETVDASATVASDGKWKLSLPKGLKFPADGVVQIFLKDTVGNENPVAETAVHDAIFQAATKVTTLNVFPLSTLTQTVTNLTTKAPPVESTPMDPTLAIVGDQLRYTLTVGNVGSLEWLQAVVDDIVPSELTVTQVTLDGVEQTLNVISNNVSLTIPKIAVNQESVITIDVVVTKETVGKGVLNQAMVADGDESLKKTANTLVQVAAQPIIKNTQTVENLTDNSGKFNVGDTVKYHLNTTNTANRGTVTDTTINNAIPQGLRVDPATLKLTDATGEETVLPASSLSADNRLSVNAGSLAGGETATVTFEAKIQLDLAETNVKNSFNTVATYLSPNDVQSEEASVSYVVEAYTGVLSLAAVPESLSFGSNLAIKPIDKSYGLVSKTGDLIVTDTRVVRSQWTLDARMSQQLTANASELINALSFKPKTGNETVITDTFSPLYSETNTTDENQLSSHWSDNGEGFYLNVKAGVGIAGSYQGTIEWVLKDTPA